MLKTINRCFSRFLEMFKEAGVYSINRVIPVCILSIITALFLVVTIYLLIAKTAPSAWSGYGELTTAYMTALGICATWLTGNKIANSKYNTEPGAPGKPLGPLKPDENVVKAMDTLADQINKR